MFYGRPGSQAAVRDFEFMCMGLPVNYYAAIEGEKIIGFLSTNPQTDKCDEISALYVEPGYRQKGFGHSLLSTATKDILAKDKQPGYWAGGGHPDDNPHFAMLFHMLIKIGYYFIST